MFDRDNSVFIISFMLVFALLSGGLLFFMQAPKTEGFDNVRGVYSPMAKSASLEHSFNALMIRVLGNEELRPDEAQAVGVDDPSDVFLIVKDVYGNVKSGSGTVIDGEHDMNRILTAAHVSGTEKELSHVTVISNEGEAIAEAVPVRRPEIRHKTFRYPDAQRDQTVLMVTRLIGDETPDDWEARGATLSANQPDRMMFIVSNENDSILSPGASGSGLRNSANEIVGTVSAAASNHTSHLDEETRFIFMTLSANPSGSVHDDIIRFRDKVSPVKLMGAFGIAVPVTSKQILADIGVVDVKERSVSPFRGEVSGYPFMEAMTGVVHVTPFTRVYAPD